MQTCPACGEYNRPSDQTCVKCGASLAPNAAAAGAPASAFPPTASGAFPPSAASAFPASSGAFPPPGAPPFPQPAAPAFPAATPQGYAPGQPPAVGVTPSPIAPLLPFKPSGRIGSPIVALLIALVGAIPVGIVYQLASGINKLFLVSEAIGGAVVGLVVLFAVRVGKVRSKPFAGLLALIAGLLTFAVYQAAESQADRPQLVSAITSDLAQQNGVSPAKVRPLVEQHLTPVETLKLDLSYRAATGIVLQDTNSTSVSTTTSAGTQSTNPTSATPISGNMYYAFLGLEALIFVFVAGAIGVGSLSTPYCENCGRWTKYARVLRLQPGQAPRVLSLVGAQQWDALARERAMGKTDASARCDVGVFECRSCPEGTLKVDRQVGKQAQVLVHLFVPTGVTRYLKKAALLPMAPVGPGFPPPGPSSPQS
jgi:hypothetical protein